MKKFLLSAAVVLVCTFLGGLLALMLAILILSFLYASPSGYLGDGYQLMAVFFGTPIGLIVGFAIGLYLAIRYIK